jgi:hypothetical protein
LSSKSSKLLVTSEILRSLWWVLCSSRSRISNSFRLLSFRIWSRLSCRLSGLWFWTLSLSWLLRRTLPRNVSFRGALDFGFVQMFEKFLEHLLEIGLFHVLLWLRCWLRSSLGNCLWYRWNRVGLLWQKGVHLRSWQSCTVPRSWEIWTSPLFWSRIVDSSVQFSSLLFRACRVLNQVFDLLVSWIRLPRSWLCCRYLWFGCLWWSKTSWLLRSSVGWISERLLGCRWRLPLLWDVLDVFVNRDFSRSAERSLIRIFTTITRTLSVGAFARPFLISTRWIALVSSKISLPVVSVNRSSRSSWIRSWSSSGFVLVRSLLKGFLWWAT